MIATVAQKLANNVSRVKGGVLAIVAFIKAIDRLFKWEDGFGPSFFALLAWILQCRRHGYSRAAQGWIISCLYLSVWMLPVLLALVMLYFKPGMKEHKVVEVRQRHHYNAV